MKRKTGVMILLLVCFFISISAVSASENIDIENSIYNSSIDSFSENAEILGLKVKTIEELDNEIQNSQPESTIKLKNDYIISNETTIDGIDIYTNITIDGQGHTIDGSSSDMDYLFRIYEDNVVLKKYKLYKSTIFDSSDNTNLTI